MYAGTLTTFPFCSLAVLCVVIHDLFFTSLHFTEIHLPMEPNFLDIVKSGLFTPLALSVYYFEVCMGTKKQFGKDPVCNVLPQAALPWWCVLLSSSTRTRMWWSVPSVTSPSHHQPRHQSLDSWGEKYKVMLNFHYVVREDPSPSNMHLLKSSRSAGEVICHVFVEVLRFTDLLSRRLAFKQSKCKG